MCFKGKLISIFIAPLLLNSFALSAQTSEPYLVKNINPSASSFPGNLVNFNNELYFLAFDGTHGFEMWRSNGTDAGTTILKDIDTRPNEGGGGAYTTVVGDTLFFLANDNSGSGQELWKTDGTEGGTVMVAEVRSGTASALYFRLTAVGNKLFFRANNGSNGSELWVSDGTELGTFMVKDIASVSGEGSTPDHLTDMNGTLFFTAWDETNVSGYRLWKSDGTELGTTVVNDIRPIPGNNTEPFEVYNNNLYFVVDDFVSNRFELWKSDGTDGGTARLKDTNPSGFDNPKELTVVGDTLFFQATNGSSSGIELWKTDGTEIGTVMVKDINPGGGSSIPKFLTAVGNSLFFKANDGTNGEELWISDGTAVGTGMVKNIAAGNGSPNLSNFKAFKDKLYFGANSHPVYGWELWQSDGTAEGTMLVKDINPDTASSSPDELTVVGNTLFFEADDGTNGKELWAIKDGVVDECSFYIIKTANGNTVTPCL